MISFQLIGPSPAAGTICPGPASRPLAALLPYERALPPGLAGRALSPGGRGDVVGVVLRCVALAAYASIFGVLFGWRLRAQFRGENLSESPAPAAIPGPRSRY